MTRIWCFLKLLYVTLLTLWFLKMFPECLHNVTCFVWHFPSILYFILFKDKCFSCVKYINVLEKVFELSKRIQRDMILFQGYNILHDLVRQ